MASPISCAPALLPVAQNRGRGTALVDVGVDPLRQRGVTACDSANSARSRLPTVGLVCEGRAPRDLCNGKTTLQYCIQDGGSVTEVGLVKIVSISAGRENRSSEGSAAGRVHLHVTGEITYVRTRDNDGIAGRSFETTSRAGQSASARCSKRIGNSQSCRRGQ